MKSIGLAGDAVQDKAMAYEVASVGSNFGLVGAMVDAGIQSDRTAVGTSAISWTSGVDQKIARTFSYEGSLQATVYSGASSAKR